MDYATSKAMMIGIGIFATIFITSAVFVALGYVLDIYKNVSKIDYSNIMDVGEFEKYSVSMYKNGTYSGDTLTGIEILNMINKYVSQNAQNRSKFESEVSVVTLRDCLTKNNTKELYTTNGHLKILPYANYYDLESTNSNFDTALAGEYYCNVTRDRNDVTIITYKRK